VLPVETALRFELPPGQIEVGVAVITGEAGAGFTVTTNVAVEEQPDVVPVTVYVEEVVGINETPSVWVLTPSDQVYVVAPPPDKVTLLPAHTVAGDGVELAVTLGTAKACAVVAIVPEAPPPDIGMLPLLLPANEGKY
jgi:hypothetical protein